MYSHTEIGQAANEAEALADALGAAVASAGEEARSIHIIVQGIAKLDGAYQASVSVVVEPKLPTEKIKAEAVKAEYAYVGGGEPTEAERSKRARQRALEHHFEEDARHTKEIGRQRQIKEAEQDTPTFLYISFVYDTLLQTIPTDFTVHVIGSDALMSAAEIFPDLAMREAAEAGIISDYEPGKAKPEEPDYQRNADFEKELIKTFFMDLG